MGQASRIPPIFLTACLALAFAKPAPGTTLIPMDLGDLTAKAEDIFVGTVSDVRSEKADGMIVTYVTFSDLRVVKGSLEDSVEVRLSGGTVGEETLHVYGMPRFEVGERNLVFLAGNGRHGCPIVGWGQGRFRIRHDQGSRQELVFDDGDAPVAAIRDRQIVRATRERGRRGSPGVPDAGHVVIAPPVAPRGRLSLESFVAVIETRMGNADDQK